MVAASIQPEPLPVGLESRLAEFTELVATAIANADSRAELAVSKARIVGAGTRLADASSGDLHDGTQQRLVSLALELHLAQSSFPPELTELHAEVGRVAGELDGAIDDLRRALTTTKHARASRAR